MQLTLQTGYACLSIYRFEVLTIIYAVKTKFHPLGWVKLVLPGFLPTLW